MRRCGKQKVFHCTKDLLQELVKAYLLILARALSGLGYDRVAVLLPTVCALTHFRITTHTRSQELPCSGYG
jgi:hypothetical protein